MLFYSTFCQQTELWEAGVQGGHPTFASLLGEDQVMTRKNYLLMGTSNVMGSI